MFKSKGSSIIWAMYSAFLITIFDGAMHWVALGLGILYCLNWWRLSYKQSKVLDKAAP